MAAMKATPATMYAEHAATSTPAELDIYLCQYETCWIPYSTHSRRTIFQRVKLTSLCRPYT